MRICTECKEEAHDIRLKICMNCMSDLPIEDKYDIFDNFIKKSGL